MPIGHHHHDTYFFTDLMKVTESHQRTLQLVFALLPENIFFCNQVVFQLIQINETLDDIIYYIKNSVSNEDKRESRGLREIIFSRFDIYPSFFILGQEFFKGQFFLVKSIQINVSQGFTGRKSYLLRNTIENCYKINFLFSFLAVLLSLETRYLHLHIPVYCLRFTFEGIFKNFFFIKLLSDLKRL